MTSELKILSNTQRVNRAKTRLAELVRSADHLSQLRDPKNGANIELRCELAYLVKLIDNDGRGSVEVCIAGKPNDETPRRVFAKTVHVTGELAPRIEEGSLLDLYTGRRTAQAWGIPFCEALPEPARVRVPRRKKPVSEAPTEAPTVRA